MLNADEIYELLIQHIVLTNNISRPRAGWEPLLAEPGLGENWHPVESNALHLPFIGLLTIRRGGKKTGREGSTLRHDLCCPKI